MYANPYYRPYQTENELEHYSVLGMKWGVRRYQNKDGTLTQEGSDRYRNANVRYQNAKRTKKKLEKSEATRIKM